jgi:16S rRNA (cytosine967-C5)-methyltransferase
MTVLDRHSKRIEQVHENLKRLGLNANTIVSDAADVSDWWDGKKFDKILLDAPCSATGVIRRHPEIKWLRNPEQVNTVVRTQACLLTALWPLLKPGGKLVYATCSLLKRENHAQIQKFMENHSDAEVEMPVVEWGIATSFGRQIIPGEARMDGFFYAVLRKSA